MMRTVCWTAAIVVTIGCEVPETQDVAAERRECPHTWTDTTERDSPQPTLSGEITDVPEYHDCQRFVVRNAQGELVYDSLFAIFAYRNLNGFDVDLYEAEQGQPGRAGVAAAEILAYNGYEPLGINPSPNGKPANHCLIIFRDSVPGQIAQMHATIVPVDQLGGDCRGPKLEPRGFASTVLEVQPQSISGLPDDEHYPPVARWDWDADGQEHYVSVKCGRKVWCDIGRPGFQPAPTYDDANLPPDRRRVRAIRGWYDEQLLASVQQGRLQPTLLRGTIFPHPELGAPDDRVGKFAAQWVQVASVAIVPLASEEVVMADLQAYKDRLNFDPVAPTATLLNTIWLCQGRAVDCRVPDSVSTNCKPAGRAAPGAPPPEVGTWWAAYDDTDGQNDDWIYKCVSRYPMETVAIPGTARWRWHVGDETTWKRCLQGCCDAQM